MGMIRVCDRCGEKIKMSLYCELTKKVHPVGPDGYELCLKCSKSLDKWLKNEEDKTDDVSEM
jgi:hypothetical protein